MYLDAVNTGRASYGQPSGMHSAPQPAHHTWVHSASNISMRAPSQPEILHLPMAHQAHSKHLESQAMSRYNSSSSNSILPGLTTMRITRPSKLHLNTSSSYVMPAQSQRGGKIASACLLLPGLQWKYYAKVRANLKTSERVETAPSQQTAGR